MFKPGEWAVLRNKSGGRLFEVDRVEDEPGNASYWVFEKSQRGNPDYDFKVWNNQLVKVLDRDAAIGLAAILKSLHEEQRVAVDELERQFQRRMDRAVRDREIDQNESEVSA